MRVCVGGTFDILHSGHKALLDKAFNLSDNVLIGLTSDAFAVRERKTFNPYEVRRKNLEAYANDKGRKYQIVMIEDEYGPSASMTELDAIVVSEDTKYRALEINSIRKKKGLRPLEVFTIPMVMAQDGKPISARRIRGGHIDAEGRASP